MLDTALTFTFAEVAKFVSLAFMFGGLAATVAFTNNRVKKLEGWQEEAVNRRERERKEVAGMISSAIGRIEIASKERMDRLEQHNQALEERFLQAIDKLGTNINNLAVKLEAVVATHEARFESLTHKD